MRLVSVVHRVIWALVEHICSPFGSQFLPKDFQDIRYISMWCDDRLIIQLQPIIDLVDTPVKAEAFIDDILAPIIYLLTKNVHVANLLRPYVRMFSLMKYANYFCVPRKGMRRAYLRIQEMSRQEFNF